MLSKGGERFFDACMSYFDICVINYFMEKNISNTIFYFSVILSSLLFVSFPSGEAFIVWFSTILGVLSSKMASYGKWHMFVFDIISYVAYIYTCLTAVYFGEVVLSLIVIVINLFCLFEWKNHQKDNIIIINSLNKREINFAVFCATILLFAYSGLLHMANTNFVILNALATISYLLGSYFCYRRSILQFYSWIVYEIAFITLWLISAINGNIENSMFLIGGTSELIFDVLGIMNWKKYQKSQTQIFTTSFLQCKKAKW